MTTRTSLSLALTALAAVGTVASATIASEPTSKQGRKDAAQLAGKATKALARRDAAGAVTFAEGAVQLSPQAAEYRLLLGQTYLQAGRFASARQAFADVLQLQPCNGKAALNYALAQVASGDAGGARQTLDSHATLIPIGDLGLAVALAGDPAGAVAILTTAARQPGADAKVRQNLALSLGLAGQWRAARMVAEADMSPADVDVRMEQWAAFAQPTAAWEQVATLLGVQPAMDTGQPIALALTAPLAPTGVPIAAPVVAPFVAAPVQPLVLAVPSPVIAIDAPVWPTASVAVRPLPIAAAKLVFAARREVVQPLPGYADSGVPVLRATGVTKVALSGSAPRRVTAAKGDWYIQLGAYPSAATARDGWARAKRRYAGFAAQQPTGVLAATRSRAFYRLSVGGFTKADASSMCRQYRWAGGDCFIRRGAGDQTAQWLRGASVRG